MKRIDWFVLSVWAGALMLTAATWALVWAVLAR